MVPYLILNAALDPESSPMESIGRLHFDAERVFTQCHFVQIAGTKSRVRFARAVVQHRTANLVLSSH